VSRTIRLFAMTALAAPLLLAAAQTSAEERACRGTIRATTVDNPVGDRRIGLGNEVSALSCRSPSLWMSWPPSLRGW